MSSGYVCTSSRCHELNRAHLETADDAVEHLRGMHYNYLMIQRPAAPGIPDSHGNCWYCFGCLGDWGKDHKSFKSGRAMWDHLGSKHDNLWDSGGPMTARRWAIREGLDESG